MKKKIETLLTGVEKAAGDLIDNVVQAVDQNDDGKFDLLDVSVIAESVESAMQKGKQAVKDSVDEKARQHELNVLRPISTDRLNSQEFSMSKLVRIVERDKKFIESEVCQGSIGHESEEKGLRIVNIFQDSIDAFGLEFYPDSDSEFYYVDPTDSKHYISLDEYFSYLKIVRVNELKKIAQDLGAKSFEITYMEEHATFSRKKARASADVKQAGHIDADYESEKKSYTNMHIEAKMCFPGHTPVKPQLKYLQKDPSIQTLVAMRMDETSPLMHESYMLKLSHSSGIKENDAVKIDAVLKSLKCAGNTTFASEVQNEARRFLEYDIEF